MPDAMAPLSVYDSWPRTRHDGSRRTNGDRYPSGTWHFVQHSTDTNTSRVNGHARAEGPYARDHTGRVEDPRGYFSNRREPPSPGRSYHGLKRSRDEYERPGGDHRFSYASYGPASGVTRDHLHSPSRAGGGRRQEARGTSVSDYGLRSSPDRHRHHLPSHRSPTDSGARPENVRDSTRGRSFAHDISPPKSPFSARFTQSSPPERSRSLRRGSHDVEPRVDGPNRAGKAPEQHHHKLVEASEPIASLQRANGLSLDAFDVPNSNNMNVELNGHKKIPTGPKKKFPNMPDAVLLPEVGLAIKKLPHIFISGAFLTPKTATVQHLHLSLRQYVHEQSPVHVDSTGYYVTFKDDQQGRDDLNACYRAKHRNQLFGQYTLEMVRFPDGQVTANIQQEIPIVSSADLGRRDTLKQTDRPATSRMDADTNLPETVCTEKQGSPPTADDNRLADPRKKSRPPSLLVNTFHTSSASACEGGQKSSPVRVPSRDKDDTASSVSSWTDFSTSKPMKCHICKAAAVTESEALVQCSTCPRRYHRRCHSQPQIPRDLGSTGHIWQCRRCIRKRVAPKSSRRSSPLANSSFPSSLSHPTDFENLPQEAGPISIDTQIAAQVGSPAMTTPVNGGILSPDKGTSSVDGVVAMSGPHQRARVQPVVEETPPETSLRQFVDEADNLVEQSFNGTASQPSTSGRSAALSKKIQRPDSNGASTPSKKHHKSSDGDADKDITMAGTADHETAFANENLRENVEAVSEKLTASRAAPHSPNAAPDPLGSHRNSQDLSRAHDSPFEGGENDEVDQLVNASGSRQSDGSGFAKAGLQNASTAPSMKPTKLQRVKCEKCNRSIAYNPSGKRLCTHCKRGGTTTAVKPVVATNEVTKKTKDVLPLAEASHKGQSPISTDIARNTRIKEPKIYLSTMKAASGTNVAAHVALPASASGKDVHMPLQVEETSQSKGHDSDLDFWKPPKPVPDVAQPARSEMNQPTPPTVHETEKVNPMAPSLEQPAVQETREASTRKDRDHKKRQSFRSLSRGSSDLGDSNSRPAGTYKILIGMALMSQRDVPMTGQDITQWIADNIPGYVREKDSVWEKSLRATITMHQEGNPSRNKPLWKPQDKSVQPFLWTLLPGVEKDLLRWDPERKEPVSASTPLVTRPESMPLDSMPQATNVQIGADLVSEPEPQADLRQRVTISPPSTNGGLETQSPRKKRKMAHDTTPSSASQPRPVQRPQVKVPIAAPMPVVTRREQCVESGSSSDEDPLARGNTRTASPQPPVAPVHSGGDDKETEQHPVASIGLEGDDLATGWQPESQPPSIVDLAIPRVPAIVTDQSMTLTFGDQRTLAQFIKEDAENAEFTATSLFKEWPEHDPENTFDRAAKIREIQQRPNRKRHMRSGHDAWSAWKPPHLLAETSAQPTPAASDRQYRSPRKPMFGIDPDTFDASGLTPCDTVEELFDIPPNLMTIMSEGQIAFRDGTRNEDGSLPRAREIFKSGYA